ncbi:putative immunoglobulin-blocking virulence protein [Mycoplasmopsis ciconiae]|uniref:Immunoglobulin-blocking virulence protein n=1 Tax=Mycoplasmopsis ciconiae TaxID=561067 RepID=A0ABU7MKY0_9BACT|nr:putative immunoglobulin-blocking virulence protein [Mycoplasmopsis ciconiae]
MTKAKAKKLLIAASMIGGVVVGSLSVSAIIISSTSQDTTSAKLIINDSNDKNILRSEEIVYNDKNNSILDRNVEVVTKEKEEDKITTINFVLKGEIVGVKTFANLQTTEDIVLSDYLPTGFKLAKEENKIVLNEVNNVEVIQEDVKFTTVFDFVYNNTTIKEITIQTINDEAIDVQKILPAELQAEYRIKFEEGFNLQIGATNKIPLEKITKKFVTKIIYKTAQKTLLEKDFTTYDDQKVNWESAIPQGYELANKEQEVVINKNQTNEILLVEIKKEEVEEEIKEEVVVPKVEEVVMVETTLKFRNFGKFFEEIKISTPQDSTINAAQYLPQGYSFVKQNTDKSGGIIIVDVKKETKEYTTTLRFINNGQVVHTKSNIKTYGDNPIQVNLYLPEGYELVNKNQTAVLGQINDIPVNLIEKKAVEENPKEETTPAVVIKPKEVVEEEIKVVTPPSTTVTEDTKPQAPKEEKNPIEIDKSFEVLKETEAIRKKEGNFNTTLDNQPDIDVKLEPTKPTSSADKEEIIRKAQESVQRIKRIADKYSKASSLTDADWKEIHDALGVTSQWEDNFNWFKNNLYDLSPGRDNFTHFKLSLDWVNREFQQYKNKGMIPVLNWQGGGIIYAFDYVNEKDNPVLNSYIKLNESRTFGSSNKYPHRDPSSVANGDYPGWSKTAVTNEYSQFGASVNDGVEIFKYTINPDNNTPGNREPKVIAVLDATNKNGYAKFLDILKKADQAGKRIDGIVIKRIGELNESQSFRDTLKDMPESIKKVSLFFTGKDTSSVYALKDKKIDEVEIFTSGSFTKTYDKYWGIDPISFKNTKVISFDWNAHQDYGTNVNVSQSIVFNTLRFQSSSISEINEGLYMTFVSRRGERIFQGIMPGSYPTILDFSKTSLQSMKGLDLHGYAFYEVVFNLTSNTFTVDLTTLSQQNWKNLLVKGPKRPEINFTGKQIQNLHLKGSTISNNYGQDLYGLMEGLRNYSLNVYVDSEAMKNAILSTSAWRSFGSNKRIFVGNPPVNSNGASSSFNAGGFDD